MATLAEWQAQQVKDNAIDVSQANEDFNFGSEDSGWLASMAAGVPSGIFKIFEGAATLGATLLDLGVDKDRADSVEEFFSKINPFDEAANATAAGKITELIVNLGVPGAPAFKIGTGLFNAAAKARSAGTYATKIPASARSLAQGAAATGLSDVIFVGNVEDSGTFGDFLGGPTELDRDTDSPLSEILNRVKFGIEGTAFAGAIAGAGAGISKLRNPTNLGKAPKDKMDKFFETISQSLRARGKKNQYQKNIDDQAKGGVDADTAILDRNRDQIDNLSLEIGRKYSKVAGNKISAVDQQQKVLNEMNEVLMSGKGNGKLLNKNSFQLIDEIKIDPTTSYPFRNGEGLLEKVSKELPLPSKVPKFNTELGKIVKDPVTGKVIKENVKTGNRLYNVVLNEMDPTKVKAFRNKLIKTYKATPKQADDLFNTFTKGRERIGELFTSIGKRLRPDSLKKFSNALKQNINNVVDRGYSVFKNNRGQTTVAGNFPPTNTVLKETFDFYKKTSIQKGYKLSDEILERLVRDSWESSTIDKGFVLGSGVKPGQVKLQLPRFLIKQSKKSVLEDLKDPTFSARATTNLAKVTGIAKPIIQKLLGKTNSPINTLVEGVSNLSPQAYSGEAFDAMVRKSNQLKIEYDKWLNGFKQIDPKTKKEVMIEPKTGPEPSVPFLFDNSGEGYKYVGGGAGDLKLIGGGNFSASEIDRFIGKDMKLKGADNIEKAKIKKMDDITKNQLLNPLSGKYALTPVAESFEKTQEWLKGLPAQIYNNLILYPKGTSQMAKTVLAPFTHVRNFISAASFAGANGILPFGNIADVRAAYTALQAPGVGMRGTNQAYQDLLRLGVVNSNVRLNQVLDLLKDAKFGEILNNKNSDFALDRIMQRFKKIKKGAEDFYTAEDDFWKIFTFLGEKSRIGNAYKKAGLSLGQEFTDINGVKRLLNDKTLNELSADLVKNNVPNYAFVSEFVKGLRKFPLGNFVAFPAEIMRTGTNIVETALKEINYTIIGKQGLKIKPLAARGRQRLMGMAITTAAIPLGTIAALETIYDISKDEINAMKRYVADWSKNSVLLPFKKEDGSLQYVDFSHLNAYDTLTRPIQTILNKVEQGRADEDGIMDDFVLGLIESGKELLNPFVTESIWTEALQDVAPILGRNGTDSNGRRVWNPEDSRGNKLMKAVGHLVKAQAPLNWNQLERLGISMFPVDSEGRFSERGDEYQFGNEALGIAGLRRVDVDPKKSFNYKISDYKKGVRNSRNLFTSATLKGGIVSPENLIDAYINANRALYGINRELYEDIEAAKILGMSQDSIAERMRDRGERKVFNFLDEGSFRPLTISKDLQNIFQIRASELGVANPYERAQGVIDSIQNQLLSVSIKGDLFPEIENPFDVSIIPNLVDQIGDTSIPTNVSNTSPNIIGGEFTNLPAEQYNALNPFDELGNAYLEKKRKGQR